MTTSRDVRSLAAIFTASGVVHLLRPQVYEPIMPALVPRHREVIYASGVAELLCATGLLTGRFRRPAGWASAALLLAVFPANVKMALDATSSRSRGRAFTAATWARLPMQLPMIRTALRAARD